MEISTTEPGTQLRRGVHVAAITPVHADRPEADLPRLAAYARWLLESGAAGVAPAGTTGEGVSIPFGQRMELPQHLREAGVPADRAIIGTGAASTGDAIALTRAALEAGFPNVLVLPPFYFKSPGEEGLLAHFATLIEAVGDARLRLHLYNFPKMTAVPIPPQLVARLRASYGPVVAGVKDSSGDMDTARGFLAAAEGLAVFPCSEALISEAREAGCAGIISATVNALPGLAQRGWETGAADDLSTLARLRAIIARYPLSAALKEIAALRSGDGSWRKLLPPLTPLPRDSARALRDALQELAEQTGHRVI